MKYFWGACENARRSICLLACGELTPEERGRLQNHLAVCKRCQEYQKEISNVAGALTSWERSFEEVEPGQAGLALWASDFALAQALERSATQGGFYRLRDWCKEVVWPNRWVWTGLAAVWLVILGVNLSASNQTAATRSVSPSLEMVRAYLTQEGFLSRPRGREQKQVTKPPARPDPAPRSDEHRRRSSAV
jgi:anti-sigma factor RsiW